MITMQRFLKAGLLAAILAVPTVMHAADAPVRGLTSGRLMALIPGLLGLISVIAGSIALRAVNRNGKGKRGSIVALAAGMIGLLMAVLHIVRSVGPIGSGSGKLGAIVASVLSVIGIILGAAALARYRKLAARNSN